MVTTLDILCGNNCAVSAWIVHRICFSISHQSKKTRTNVSDQNDVNELVQTCIFPCSIDIYDIKIFSKVLISHTALEILATFRTVAVECCYQNVGIATSLALTMFQGNDLNQAMGVPFFYGMVEAIFVGFYCIGCWKAGWSKAPADASFWNILYVSYEVLEVEMREINEIEVSISESSDGSSVKPPEKAEGNVLMTYFSMMDTKNIPVSIPKEPSGYTIQLGTFT